MTTRLHPIMVGLLSARLAKAEMYLGAFILNRTAIDVENKSYWRRQEFRADREIKDLKQRLGTLK
jgi:hypothetical protein